MPVRNAYVFVADALREDYLPNMVADEGASVPTIAAGTNSPEGFSSIVSGLYPNQHGARAFTQRLNPEFNYLNAIRDSYDTRFYQTYKTELASVLGVDQTTENPVPDIDPPFVILERDMTTHAPYGYSSYEDVNVSPQEYFGGKNVDWGRIRTDYESASERVAERFRRRIDELNDRGLLDDTLVVFTSDHGELLGEHGELSHGDPLVPELARVPSVLRHPDGEAPDVELMSHIDILPTIAELMDEPAPWTVPGHSVYSDNHVSYRICEHRSEPHSLEESSFQNLYDYEVRSVWGPGGGYAFNETRLRGKAVHAFRQAPLFNPLRGRDALRSVGGVWHHLRGARTFDNPKFDQTVARTFLNKMDGFPVQLSAGEEGLSGRAREELEHLGYI